MSVCACVLSVRVSFTAERLAQSRWVFSTYGTFGYREDYRLCEMVLVILLRAARKFVREALGLGFANFERIKL